MSASGLEAPSPYPRCRRLEIASRSAGTPQGRRFRPFPLPGPQLHLCTVGPSACVLHTQLCDTRGLPAGRRQVAPRGPPGLPPPGGPVQAGRVGPSGCCCSSVSRPRVLTSASRNSPFKIAASPPAFWGLWLPTDVTRADGPVSVCCCGVFQNAVGVRSSPLPPLRPEEAQPPTGPLPHP